MRFYFKFHFQIPYNIIHSFVTIDGITVFRTKRGEFFNKFCNKYEWTYIITPAERKLLAIRTMGV